MDRMLKRVDLPCVRRPKSIDKGQVVGGAKVMLKERKVMKKRRRGGERW
jgi:hypothetical protein